MNLDSHITTFTADDSVELPTAIGIRYGVSVAGDFGGGTFQAQHINNDEGITYTEGEFTEAGGCWFLAMDTRTRFVLSGSATPNLTMRLVALKK
jgi:hypothetical protein